MKKYLKSIIDKSKIFGIIVQTLIFLSVLQVSLETLPSLKQYSYIWNVVESIFVVIFSIEYLIRLYAAEKRLKFIFSFYGIIDLVSIIPSILSHGLIDLRFVRSLRLIRIFRILKLARYSSALERIKKAFKEIKEELIIFMILSTILIYLSSAGIYFFEHEAQPEIFKSIPHSIWWSIVTLTTVGYGDIYPITAGGKIFTSIILFIGLGIVAVPAGLFASAFSNDKPKK